MTIINHALYIFIWVHDNYIVTLFLHTIFYFYVYCYFYYMIIPSTCCDYFCYMAISSTCCVEIPVLWLQQTFKQPHSPKLTMPASMIPITQP